MIQYNYTAYTHKGLLRSHNEDILEHSVIGSCHLFILCDGMGGAANGEEASSTVVNSILAYFKTRTEQDLSKAIYNSVVAANNSIQNLIKIDPQKKGMGSTLCMSLFYEDKVYITHVGDSRAYLFTSKKLYQLTKDDSYVNQLYDADLISYQALKNHKYTNRITKAVGTSSQIKPTITTGVKLKKGDLLLQCSDGLTDLVNDREICTILESNALLEKKIIRLKTIAFERGAKDNISIQLIEIEQSKNKKTIFTDQTLKDKKELSKKNKLIKLVLIAFSIFVVGYALYHIYPFFEKKEANNKNVIGKDSIQNKVLKKKPVVTKTEGNDEVKKPAYFIIGFENDKEKMVFRNIYRYGLATGDKTSFTEFELFNHKKTNEFTIGDTIYIPKTKIKKQ